MPACVTTYGTRVSALTVTTLWIEAALGRLGQLIGDITGGTNLNRGMSSLPGSLAQHLEDVPLPSLLAVIRRIDHAAAIPALTIGAIFGACLVSISISVPQDDDS